GAFPGPLANCTNPVLFDGCAPPTLRGSLVASRHNEQPGGSSVKKNEEGGCAFAFCRSTLHVFLCPQFVPEKGTDAVRRCGRSQDRGGPSSLDAPFGLWSAPTAGHIDPPGTIPKKRARTKAPTARARQGRRLGDCPAWVRVQQEKNEKFPHLTEA